eukprot:TRINITY_DN1930_c0_g1_i1.p1 TRINITY_DN1930_c0_g1~~TRINITY_DN1930_c0_g1_i1.p1  ORF type:complete len:476 (-),score=85.82 TRINITY_DN1930_c0_g1_i1:14-1294(-)
MNNIEMVEKTTEVFFRKICNSSGDLSPSFKEEDLQFVYMTESSYSALYFVFVLKVEIPAMLALEVLRRIREVFKDYCGDLNEEFIRKNFVLMYELLDEMIDFGVPQTTSSSTLKSFVFDEPIKSDGYDLSAAHIFDSLGLASNKTTVPSSSANQSIYGTDSSSKTNQVFVDVIEKLLVNIDSDGSIIRSDIVGSIVMRSFLVGNPQIKLALNDKITIGDERTSQAYDALVMDDCSFHECVTLGDFEKDKSIDFFPPEGEFTLLNYRLSAQPRLPLKMSASVQETSNRIDVVIRVLANLPSDKYAHHAKIVFPIPVHGISSVICDMETKAFEQNAEYDETSRKVVWIIPKFFGGNQLTLRIKITPSHSIASLRSKLGSIHVQFEIPMWTTSNIQIVSLKVLEKYKTYEPLRWIRYITDASLIVGLES